MGTSRHSSSVVGLTLRRRRILWAYAFLAVPLLFFVAIRIWPMLQAFQLSVTRWHVDPAQRVFVGFHHFQQMWGDAKFLQALRNTALYAAIGVPAQVFLGLGIALLLNNIRRLRGLFRAIYFAPYVTPAVAVAWAWSYMLSPHLGVVNTLLGYVGIPPQPFLTSPTQALPTVAAVVVWQFVGFHVVIFLVALNSIPREIYEAARVDGASGWSLFRRITFPLLNPSLVLSVIMATASPSIGILQLFTQVMNLRMYDPGGPLGSTSTVVLYMYQMAFRRFDFGYAAAIIVVLFAIILTISLLQLRVLRRRFEY